MLFKISFLHEHATLRMYTWNFKKLTTRRVTLWKRKKVYPSIFYRNLKKRFEGKRILEYWTSALESLKGLNHKFFFFFLRFITDNFSTSITFLRYLVLPWQHLFNYVIFVVVVFITGKMSFPTSLCYLTPCGITILRALGPAQYGIFHYLRKDCTKNNKTARIYRFFKFFLPRHPLSPRNLLLSPVVLVVWFWYAIKYLKVSHFSFPSTPILHECTVNKEGKYFSTHKIIRKNLQVIVSHIW